MRVLAAQGQTLLSPSRRTGLHPLVVPLAVSADGRQVCAPWYCQKWIWLSTNVTPALFPHAQVTAVLRWPTPVDEFVLPVVTVPTPSSHPSHGSGSRVSLVARSASEYIHRALAEEDAAVGDAPGGSRPVASAVGDTPLPFAFATGDVARAMRAAAATAAAAGSQPRSGSRHAPLDVYLIQKCGKFPDVCARLVQGHIAAGDVTAAMVTADWACTHFKGWASVRAASAETHAVLGRQDEARDNARAALASGALWTLGWQPADTAARTLELAKLSGRTAAWLRENLVDGAGPANDGSPGSKAAGNQPARTPQQVALARAETLLDALALGECTWGDIGGDVQAAFTQAGRPDMARFLAACTTAAM